MKKFLLCATAFALLAGCGGSKINESELANSLANYEGACADKAFAETNAKLAEVKQLREEGKSDEADKALEEADASFKSGEMKFKDWSTSVGRSLSEVEAQKSRVAAVDAKAKKASAKDHKIITNRINALHNDVAKAAEKCDAAAAEAAVNSAEKEVAKLEALAGGAAVSTSAEVYVVKRGDCLWKISADKYANPYFWPLIYWSNKDSIKDPDLIYPNQELNIDGGHDEQAKADASKFARTRGAWSLYDNK